MNDIELDKVFDKFEELMGLIVGVEYNIETFGRDSDCVLNPLEKLKIGCLKYNLCDIDELENLSNLDCDQTLKFCDELKTNIRDELNEKIFDYGD